MMMQRRGTVLSAASGAARRRPGAKMRKKGRGAPWPPNFDLSRQLMQSPARKRKSSSGRPSVPSAENAGKGAGHFGVREGDFYRNRSPGRRCRRRRPSTASACRHWSSCRGYGARKVGWMFGGIQRPETARPERYAAACLAAAGPIKAVMRPRACVGVGAAIARPQRRRPGSGSAPSGDGSGRLEKLPSFAPVAEPMFHQRRCGAYLTVPESTRTARL